MAHDPRVRLLLFRAVARAGIATVIALPCSCTPAQTKRQNDDRPNIIWVVWDTVRVDRLSLYGCPVSTTPRLEEWAREARVFENCVATAGHTVPSHASMFTGLLPIEHGAGNDHLFLDDRFATVAELLQRHGYQTYLYSANPNISRSENFHRGFEVEEHPWDPKYLAEARRILRGKIPPHDRSSELPLLLRHARLAEWYVVASGELAQRGVQEWLRHRDRARPFFVFLNYMEAHRPCVPPESYRRRVMDEGHVAASYAVDRRLITMWKYSFGLHDYRLHDIETIAGTYDAALAELDDLFHNLRGALAAGGCLDNTVIILTSDHGEHLGEHHLMEHQYSVYNPLIRVPLVVHDPKRFPPGRERRPVMTFDIFPTLLELAAIPPPADLESRAVSLLTPQVDRVQFAEDPAHHKGAIKGIKQLHPGWDSRPWERELRAIIAGDHKLIWSSDGRHELYNIRLDPLELDNLFACETELAQRMQARLNAYLATLTIRSGQAQSVPPISGEQLRRLRSLGYAAPPETSDSADVPAE